jgi:hypothetical protein
MARLFIFAIGGTGSRVLKSLTMLLASGVKPNAQRNFEIVPIIIDPHKSNEDLKRTERLLGNYQSIVNQIGLENGFFSTPITTLDKLVGSENRASGSFTFNLQQVSNTRFKEYIDFNLLDEPNKALAKILFSGKTINKLHNEVDLLDIEMDIGFVGNPNIGSVVLNQFKDSEEFKEFASNFNAEDRIFIISSIFGGTGAAGFPTTLKNIRNAINNPNIDGVGFLQDSKIGALTVLPYFNVKIDDNSPIQKSDFIAKTKSALHYYKKNVTGNNSVNALYYIGDDYTGQPYDNDPGDGGQKNKAHFVELASALAVLDFLSIPDSDLATSYGKAVNPIYKEFFIKNDSIEIKFSDFYDYTERYLSLKLSQLALFLKYNKEHLSDAVEKEAWSNDSPQINKSFLNDHFYRSYFWEFMNSFEEWLNELQENKRAFAPFNLNSSVESFIKEKIAKYGTIFKSNFDYKEFDNILSKISHQSKTINRNSAESRFIHLFYESTEKILKTYYGLNN